MDILLSIFLVVFGLVITFAGIQVFSATLPVLGFVFGFFLGAELVHVVLNDGFLGTVTGWIVGIGVGIAFGAIAWYWWYAGVILSSGALGAVLASGLAEALGARSGVTLFIVSVIGFAAFFFLAFVYYAPIYLVILNTAGVGATIVVAGVLLLFNRIETEALGIGAASAAIRESWWWTLVWFALAIAGIGYQLGTRQRVHLPENRWVPASAARAV
jgi:hypothetical protein